MRSVTAILAAVAMLGAAADAWVTTTPKAAVQGDKYSAKMQELQQPDFGGVFEATTWLAGGALALGVIVGPGLGDLPAMDMPSIGGGGSSTTTKVASAKPKKEFVKKQPTSMAKKKLKDTSGYDMSGL